MKLGTANQIYDDCLDLVGSEEIVGKTLRTDLEKGKLTLPILNLLEASSEQQREEINRRILAEEEFDLPTLTGFAEYDDALARAVNTAVKLLEECRKEIAFLAESDYKSALLQITHFLESLLKNCRN